MQAPGHIHTQLTKIGSTPKIVSRLVVLQLILNPPNFEFPKQEAQIIEGATYYNHKL
jgi:hypothetical protein